MIWSILLVWSVRAGDDSTALVLNDLDFDEVLAQKNRLLVQFYVSWCEPCRELDIEYEKAAKKLNKAKPPIKIAKVDASLNKLLIERYSIDTFPTLIYFINKVPTQYSGGKTEESIVSWVLSKNKPGLIVTNNESELENLLDLYKVAVVLFAEENSREGKIFKTAAATLKGSVFILSTFEQLDNERNSMYMFKHFGETKVKFDGEIVQREIAKFVEEKRLSKVVDFDQEIAEKIFRDYSPVLFLFTSNYLEQQELFEKLSEEFKGLLLFCKADLANSELQNLSEYLDVSAESQPVLVILDPGSMYNKYRFSELFSYENLWKFVKTWSKGISPLKNYAKNIRVLVGDNLDEIVLDISKNVIVFFFASWCAPCKNGLESFEALVEKLENIENLEFVIVDNSESGSEITKLPSVKLYPANQKQVFEYEGQWTSSGLWQFLTAHGVIPGTQRIDL